MWSERESVWPWWNEIFKQYDDKIRNSEITSLLDAVLDAVIVEGKFIFAQYNSSFKQFSEEKTVEEVTKLCAKYTDRHWHIYSVSISFNIWCSVMCMRTHLLVYVWLFIDVVFVEFFFWQDILNSKYFTAKPLSKKNRIQKYIFQQNIP